MPLPSNWAQFCCGSNFVFNLFATCLDSHWCCVLWPTFGCCTHTKAGLTTFFQPFSSFFVLFVFECFFVDFRREITVKGWKSTKKVENGWKQLVRPHTGLVTFVNSQHIEAASYPTDEWWLREVELEYPDLTPSRSDTSLAVSDMET